MKKNVRMCRTQVPAMAQMCVPAYEGAQNMFEATYNLMFMDELIHHMWQGKPSPVIKFVHVEGDLKSVGFSSIDPKYHPDLADVLIHVGIKNGLFRLNMIETDIWGSEEGTVELEDWAKRYYYQHKIKGEPVPPADPRFAERLADVQAMLRDIVKYARKYR